MNIARIVYSMIILHEADTHFQTHLVVHHLNDVDLGDINHSINFVAKFVPHIAKVIRNRICKFLTTPMEQTGELPCGKILSDASTKHHRSRQFTSLYTIVPDSEEPIQVIYLGFEIMYCHSGWDTAAGIINCLKMKGESVILNKDQYLGVSGDGAFIHCDVQGSMDDHFEVERGSRHHDLDFMHKAGRVDINIRMLSEYAWVVEITSDVGNAYKFVNWGNEFEHFFEIAEQMKTEDGMSEYFQKMYLPNFYQETRYANSISRVMNTAYLNFPALIRTLEDAVLLRSRGNSDDKKMGAKAESIANTMNTVKFGTVLAGLSDVYTVFNSGLTVLQGASYLPHERYDLFQNICVRKLMVMIDTLEDHELCAKQDMENFEGDTDDNAGHEVNKDELEPDDEEIITVEEPSTSCFWPHLHREIPDLLEGKFRNQPLAAKHPEYRMTRDASKRVVDERQKDQISEGLKKLEKFCSRLHDDLERQVYDVCDTEHIELLRPITDLRSLAIKLKTEGVESVSQEMQPKFIETALKIAPKIKTYDISNVKTQHILFLKKLHVLCRDRSVKDIKSRSVLSEFLSSKLSLYKNIESIIYILQCAALGTGIESIVESHISVFKHIRSNRVLSDKRADDEMMIHLNGPPVAESNLILSEALNSMVQKENCEPKLHFVKGKKVRRNFRYSKVLDKELNKTSKLPFFS